MKFAFSSQIYVKVCSLPKHLRPVLLNQGSIEPQGFGESVLGVRRIGLPHLYDS